MARRPRVHWPASFHHVMLRGNGGQAIFADDADRQHICDLLAEGVERFGHRIHAYCLMGNHIHLAIEVGDVSLSRIVQNMAFRYARAINRREQRTGHLFQGRFRSIEIDRDAYLLELVRYVHCNPVRAGLATAPEAWRWSGHRTYLGIDKSPWVTTDLVLGMFAEGDRLLARRRYSGFVREGLGEPYQEEFRQDSGDAVELRLPPSPPPPAHEDKGLHSVRVPLAGLVAAVCREFGLVEAELTAPGRGRLPAEARAWIGWLAQELEVTSLSRAAAWLNRDVATLSRQVTHLRTAMRGDARLHRRADALRLRLRAHDTITQ